MLEIVKKGFYPHLENKLVDELLDAYIEAKNNFSLGGYRLNAVEAGRFCEAVLRILEDITTGQFTSLNKPIFTETIINNLSNLPSAKYSDSIRLHIPRSIRVVYDIRNKRDTAHLADGIDPNVQDATLVISVIDWILAELVRLYHKVTANEAQKIIQSIATKNVPCIEEFDGFLKVLNPNLKVSPYCLVLLYQVDKIGATYDELLSWVKPQMRSNLKRTLAKLDNDKSFIHHNGEKFFITIAGKKEVERKQYLEVD